MNRLAILVLVLITALVGTKCRNRRSAAASSPILVLATRNNFGLYLAEVLKTEGFSGFKTDSLNNEGISRDYLEGFDLIVLAQTAVTDQQRQMLTAYVASGGNLIAFRPDKNLSALFGIRAEDGEVSEAYLSIETGCDIGKGLRKESLRFHGSGDKCRLAGGDLIASFYSDVHTATAFPAVVKHARGHGVAIAFLYNLPESIVLTRQGNYRHAGQEKDGIPGLRAMDLFTGGWVDPSRNTLNQADEQMRLLTHCIEALSENKKPIPRFWYFPDTLKCLVTLNNDGEDSKEHEFVKQFEDVDSKAAKMTLYIKEVELVSKEWVDRWVRKGFEIAGHPDDTRQAEDPDWNAMDDVYKTLNNKLKTNYGLQPMQTVTNHWFVWVGKDQDDKADFAAQAKIEENNGVGLDCNYAHYDNGSSQGHFLGEAGTNQGNYTGSGLPMKFADMSGKVINVYQQLNNVYDQQYMEHKDQPDISTRSKVSWTGALTTKRTPPSALRRTIMNISFQKYR